MTFSDRARRVVTVLALLTLGLGATPAHAAAGGGDTGSWTGYAFDTCSAPSQEVMDTWRLTSPYAGVGIYLGGSNLLCEQPELDATWVATQRRRGWHLLPLWVGPQASCAAYADVMSNDVATAQQQGRQQAAAAVAAASSLGIKRGTTLFYDLEDYDLAPDDCRQAALSFVSGWTKALHAAGFRSGVYSNIAAAITSLDFADRVSPGTYAMPDDIWFAWDNGRADVRTDKRVRSDRWDDHNRVHQYALDITQSHGEQSLLIDANWVDVGRGSVAPRSRPVCRGVDVDLRRYPTLRTGSKGDTVRAAQCLLRHTKVSKAPITGKFDARTAKAVTKVQQQVGLADTGRIDRATWSALLSRGSAPLLKVGDTGSSVLRLQRALTAASGRPTRLDGVFSQKTEKAVQALQRKHGLATTGVVSDDVWIALHN